MRATSFPRLRPSPVVSGSAPPRRPPHHHRQRRGDRRAARMASAADDAPYGPPLAADARLVVADRALGVTARVVGERLAHRRYLATYDRLVRFSRPKAQQQEQQQEQQAEDQQHHQEVSYDVIGHPRCEFRFAVVFPYHPPPPRQQQGDAGDPTNANDEGDVTLVREYAHGPHRFLYSLPSGQYERDKHGAGSNLLATAQAELEEEARLEGGEWHALLPPDHPGIPEVKWCANAFEPFLCVDPKAHPSPAARDSEEEAAGLEAVRVPLSEFRRLAANGEVLLPSVAAGWMAMERLKAMGLIR